MLNRIPNVFSALTGGWDGRLLLTFLAEREKKNKLESFDQKKIIKNNIIIIKSKNVDIVKQLMKN